MTGGEQPNDWFDQLMRINDEAFAAGRYETAYHALMAALHASQDAGDPVQLRRVEQTAEQQQDQIDTDSPRHRLSSGKAKRHGAVGIFRMAAPGIGPPGDPEARPSDVRRLSRFRLSPRESSRRAARYFFFSAPATSRSARTSMCSHWPVLGMKV